MFNLQKLFEHKVTNILVAAIGVVIGVVLFIVNFYIAIDTIAKFDLQFSFPAIWKYILVAANTLTWAFMLGACRKEYLEKEITRFWYRIGVMFFFVMIAGILGETPYLWRISYGLVGIIWMAIAVMSGFLIKIVIQGQSVRAI